MLDLIRIKTKYERVLTDFTDWIGLNADIPLTFDNNGWKTWK
jgi:hypothetical protein